MVCNNTYVFLEESKEDCEGRWPSMAQMTLEFILRGMLLEALEEEVRCLSLCLYLCGKQMRMNTELWR